MSIMSFHCILLNEFRLFVNVFVLVSSMCWKDNVLATASWDSTVKVGFNHILAIKFRSSNSFKMFVYCFILYLPYEQSIHHMLL